MPHRSRFNPDIHVQSSHLDSTEVFQSYTQDYRHNTHARIRRKMLIGLVICAIAVTLMGLALFKYGVFHDVTEFMERHQEFEDKLAIFVTFTLLFLLGLFYIYTQELHHVLSDINNLIAERESLLESYNRRKKLESLGTISAGLSHEINTSLQSILGSCEMALTRLTSPEDAKPFIQRAISNSLHARKVIGSVMTFSSNGGKTDLQGHVLAEVMQDAVDFSQAFLPSQVTVVTAPPSSNIRIKADRIALLQALNNIISNAAHASGYQGAVQLISHTETIDAARANAHGIAKGAYACIEVADTGHGMTEEHLKHIFDPFFTTKEEGEGSGLGLSIVHGLVRGMNGFIDVASQPGKGTSFYIYLPLSQE